MIKRIYFSYNEDGEPVEICPFNKTVTIPVVNQKIVPYVGTFPCGSCKHNMDDTESEDGELLKDDKGFYVLCSCEARE